MALQAVVTDGGGGVQTFFDVAGLENLASALGVAGPDAGQAVGLELHAHLERVGLDLAPPALRRVDSLGDPEQVLHVVAYFVRDHVSLREVAGRPEALAQIAIERQVDVDLFVSRTVEGPDGRLREAAGRLHGAAEQHELRLLILPAHLFEELAPRVLGVGEDDRDELAQRIIGGRPLLNARRGPRVARIGALQDHARIDAEVHGEEHEHQSSDAAPHHRSAPDPLPAAVAIVYLSVSAPATHTDSSSAVGVFDVCAVLTMISHRVWFSVPGVIPNAACSRSKARFLRKVSARWSSAGWLSASL